jgi:acyl-CoA synthetase (AMP-forming)/AMP-acid ligase II
MEDKQYFEWLNARWWHHVNQKGLMKKLLYPWGKIPITEYLGRWAADYPKRPAIIFYGKTITYKELDELSNQFANFLLSNGYGKGDFILIHLYNCPQYYIAHLGGMKAGCTVIPADPLWKEIELEAPFRDAAPRVIITQDFNFPIIESLKEKFGLQHILTTSLQDFVPAKPELPIIDMFEKPKQNHPEALDLMETIAKYDSTPAPVELFLNDPASLDYTTGTTGPPKGCLHTHKGIIYARACMHTYSGNSDANPGEHTSLIIMPIFHTGGRGFMETLIFSGLTAVLLTRFEFVTALKAIDRYNVFSMWGPPEFYDAITKLPEDALRQYNLTSLKRPFCTQFNVLLNRQLRRKLNEITDGGLVYDCCYGLTETLAMNTFSFGLQDVDLLKQEQLSGVFVGLPVPETLIKIVDVNSGEILPSGAVGAIAIKSPALSPEYYKRPEETKNCYLPDGFLLTGDLGMYDEEGFFYFKGRYKEVIKVSGFTVSPREIELILSCHPALQAAVVVGILDHRSGEVPVAFVITKKEQKDKISAEQIIDWCKEKMAAYKVPRHVFFKERFPYLIGLKIDREKLKKEACKLLLLV